MKKIYTHEISIREYLLRNTEDNCIRIYDSSRHFNYKLTIDLYNQYLLIQNFNDIESIESFKKNNQFDIIVDELEKYGIEIKGVLLKNRSKIKNVKNIAEYRKSILLSGIIPPSDYTVKHLGMLYKVDLINSQHTGVFYDMRNARKALSNYYMDRKMLNLFSYTGAFSIHGLKNGLKSSINVDLSKSTLNKAKENYHLNDLKTDNRDFINDDVLNVIRYFKKKNIVFDLIIIDPPTFSRNKNKIFKIENDMATLIAKTGELLSKEGLVFTAVNTEYISIDEYNEMHEKNLKNVFYENESEDFITNQSKYLKCGLWRKLS